MSWNKCVIGDNGEVENLPNFDTPVLCVTVDGLDILALTYTVATEEHSQEMIWYDVEYGTYLYDVSEVSYWHSYTSSQEIDQLIKEWEEHSLVDTTEDI